jgi:RES domain-containing protein
MFNENQEFTDTLSCLSGVSAEFRAYRAVSEKYINTPLSAIGSIRTGGRYNPPQLFCTEPPLESGCEFEVLYVACSVEVALLEINSLIRIGPNLKAVPPSDGYARIIWTVECKLMSILDLTDGNIQNTLGIDLEQLKGAWLPTNADGRLALTQELGLSAYRSGRFDALKYPSAKARNPSDYNLAIFTDRLSESCFVKVYDESNNILCQLP